ncbi:MAG: transposase [Calditrichaeota bacterium]|nr:MAG: transposase [Calditrichota bacterium]
MGGTMPTRKTPLLDGFGYHIYNRVNDDVQLFYGDSDYCLFLKLWRESRFEECCRLYAYCLMPNHYHLLLKFTHADQFPGKMSRLFDRYLKKLNRTIQHSGRFFDNRFKNKIITDDSFLVYLCTYIHRNPLEAGLVQQLEEWPYSNYLEFVGKRRGKLWDEEFFHLYFSNHEDYEALIKNGSVSGLDPFIFDE